MHLLGALFSLFLVVQHVSAVTWFVPLSPYPFYRSEPYHRYFLTYHTPSGAQFTSFSGTLVAPTLPGAATYYLWPGLQPPDNSGVLQQVLDGRSGTWWIGSGWCCSNPSLPWGSGFNVANGASISFSNKVNSVSSGTWSTSLTSGSNTATGSFALRELVRSLNCPPLSHVASQRVRR
jgi:hypothetical protein